MKLLNNSTELLNQQHSPLQKDTCRRSIGIQGSFIANPTDLVKVRMQGDVSRPRNSSPIQKHLPCIPRDMKPRRSPRPILRSWADHHESGSFNSLPDPCLRSHQTHNFEFRVIAGRPSVAYDCFDDRRFCHCFSHKPRGRSKVSNYESLREQVILNL